MKRLLAVLALVLASVGTTLAQTNLKVTLPGTFQAVLGGSNWTPADESTLMSEVSPGVYEFVAALPKGDYQYKVAVGGTWDTNYGKDGKKGGDNIALSVPADNTVVKFVFDATKNSIVDSLNNPDKVTAPATAPPRKAAAPAAQAAPAAGGDATTLVLHYKRLKGDYEGWNVWAWPYKPTAGEGKAFQFDSQDAYGKVATITIPGKHEQFGLIIRKGEWEKKDIDSDRFVTVQPGGRTEVWALEGYKDFYPSLQAAQVNVAPPKLPAFLDASDRIRAVLFAPIDPAKDAGLVKVTVGGKPVEVKAVVNAGVAKAASTDSVDPSKVVLPGTIQAALGGAEWNPNGDITRMSEVSPGVFEFVAAFPAGSYEYKVARGGSWTENYGQGGEPGGENIALNVPANGTVVKFVFDLNKKTIYDSINNPDKVKAPASAPARAAAPAPKPVAASGPTDTVDVSLARLITPEEINQPIVLTVGNQPAMTVYAREVLAERPYWYSGNDLGPSYSRTSTTFKVWSPPSTSAEVILYDEATGGPSDTVDMQRGPNGTWSATVKGDLHGKYYQYRFRSYGEGRVAADIYCYAASVDGTRSMVVDLSRTNPANWAADKSPLAPNYTDHVIYEMHVRDFSIDPSSGVKPEWRGKYLALTQRGTTVPGTSFPTGLDYLARLGITDVHLLPIQKFNPANTNQYNWGYESTLFNVPDARYSTTPADPANTIREVKSMVAALHAAGIRVVLDVVYNHTVPISGDQSAFDSTVPYYYFRTNDEGKLLNESGVGNALNDERPMARKYVRDSTSYWAREYKVDGFRFDLLGMFTKATVVNIAEALHKIRPDLLVYGEPWTGGGPIRFGKGAQRGTGVAVFNDNIRNALRGDLDGTRLGFASAGSVAASNIQTGVAGSIEYGGAISGFTASPSESINYVSAHDNLALWDKFRKSVPDATRDARASMVKLANAVVLTSQGVPFLEGGVEMGRTKGGNNNSYNAGDTVNRFDWASAPQYGDVIDYYTGLIALRKAHPAFRLADAASVKAALQFLPGEGLPGSVVAFTLDGSKAKDSWSKILVAYNGGSKAAELKLPAGSWSVAVSGAKAGTESLGTVSGSLNLTPLSAFVLFQK